MGEGVRGRWTGGNPVAAHEAPVIIASDEGDACVTSVVRSDNELQTLIMNPDLHPHPLDGFHQVFTTIVTSPELLSGDLFERLWALRPAEPQVIRKFGRNFVLRRQQKAFGRDYAFSDTVSKAAPIPAELSPFLAWAQSTVDSRLNGLLVNWYDGAKGDEIGPHLDSETGLLPGSPIVTISLGDPRIFRMDRVAEKLRCDFTVENGSVIIIPWETNRAWKHSVPHRARDTGCRISVTLRAFSDEA